MSILRILVLGIILSFAANLSAKEMIHEKLDQMFFDQIKKLESGNLEERIQAADYLKFVTSKLAVRPLLKALKGNPSVPKSDENSPSLKFVVAQALGAMESDISGSVMVEEFKRISPAVQENDVPTFSAPEGYNLVIATGEILRNIGLLPYAKENQDAIIAALGHPNFYVRASAADGLKNLNRKDSLSQLNAAIDKEKNPFAKVAILNAIVYLNRIANQKFYDLCAFLKDESPLVRYRASIAVGEVDLKAGEFSLREALLVEHDPMVREQIKKDLANVTGFKMPQNSLLFRD
ncbi:HEAT repeat domain-containing protein [Leptospira wolffii]|uniref:HEAT repeat domain-containing protein n=1 Tax=Leptospira wolffii TaxID=409998 RepID=A0ABV5BJR4_9LEPT|nr:HEAT repeat domain-containing protein [Leptospira wolffii]TGK62307.1 HEAT repeat domain-containing protein [Leptospira wolffii]TGK68176.1 HEAT repeat domain-containing protein [Leptospira wolffii]TGK74309.1 HEAT repeat domain-containing protein [Leptospira wolffii]TGL32116.1 HEAT repeat domain-containing protein [Leptospira wolffii]TGL49119.1 HEAT repeat domain-containing protein [Leptospira wolffii]